MGQDLFYKLYALLIYYESGERPKSLSAVSEELMTTLLDTANTICPLCKVDTLADHATLLEHLHDYHDERAAQTEGSTPEKATYEFNLSDGWVKSFLKRHNMHNATTVGEMGTSDHEGATTSTKDKHFSKPRPIPILNPHCPTCTCSGPLIINITEVPEDDSSSKEDDAVTGVTYFRPKRAIAAPN